MFTGFRCKSGMTLINLDTVKDITLNEDGPVICVSFMDGGKRTYTFDTYEQQRNVFDDIGEQVANSH